MEVEQKIEEIYARKGLSDLHKSLSHMTQEYNEKNFELTTMSVISHDQFYHSPCTAILVFTKK